MKVIVDLVSLAWLASIAVGIWMLLGKRPQNTRRKYWGAALLSLAVAASLAEAVDMPDRLLAMLERPFLNQRPPLTNLGIDAIVVCGGEVNPSSAALLGMDCMDTVDRVMTAVEYTRQTGVQALILGGGGRGQPPKPREAEHAKAWIEHWKLVSCPVSTLPACRNTFDEAHYTAELAGQQGWKTIGLVTSAWHMRRAYAVFVKTTSLKVIPLSCDFRATTELENREKISFIPGTKAIDTINLWLREEFGYRYYALRGRI